MAYNEIADDQIDPESPGTTGLMTAFRDNPIGIASGSSGAPRVATKNLFASGGTGNVDFTGLGVFGGGRFYIEIENTGAASRDFQVNASDGTFGSPQLMTTIVAGDTRQIHGYWNKLTGVVNGVRSASVTLTVTGQGVTTLRFIGATDLDFSVHLMPDGGETET